MILTGETEVLGEKHYTAWVVDGWMSMEQWWNDGWGGNCPPQMSHGLPWGRTEE